MAVKLVTTATADATVVTGADLAAAVEPEALSWRYSIRSPMDLPRDFFMRKVVEGGIPFTCARSATTEAGWSEIVPPGEPLQHHAFLYTKGRDSERHRFGLWENADGTLIHVAMEDSNVQVSVAAWSEAEALQVLDVCLARIPPIKIVEPDEPNDIRMRFWITSSHGPQFRMRRIATNKWEEIADNYTPSTRNQLTDLASRQPPFGTGRLLVFHGPPGTGKTTSIRALAREWQKWCSPEYIVDPERFFGDSEYLMEMIMSSAESIENYMLDSMGLPTTAEGERWRLFIAEDADEFLTADAKHRTNQGFSRLLNLADGMVGQGLNVLVLLTTNVSVSNFNDAIMRPGRCVANVEFEKFSKPAARRWAADHGVSEDSIVHMEYTLAEMFNMTKDDTEGQIAPKVDAVAGAGTYL